MGMSMVIYIRLMLRMIIRADILQIKSVWMDKPDRKAGIFEGKGINQYY